MIIKTDNELRAFIDHIEERGVDGPMFNYEVLLFMIATDLLQAKLSVTRRCQLEGAMDFFLYPYIDKKLWSKINLHVVDAYNSLFSLKKERKFCIRADFEIGQMPCELLFKQVLDDEQNFQTSFFITYRLYKGASYSFRKGFSREETRIMTETFEAMKGLRDIVFNPNERIIFLAAGPENDTGYVELKYLLDSLEKLIVSINKQKEERLEEERSKRKKRPEIRLPFERPQL